jgi:hypothetical protein
MHKNLDIRYEIKPSGNPGKTRNFIEFFHGAYFFFASNVDAVTQSSVPRRLLRIHEPRLLV